MAFYEFKKKSPLNAVGLYTEEQVDELMKRTEELWNMLSKAAANLSTNAIMIPRQTRDDVSLEEEYRIKLIRDWCEEMGELAEECRKVMHSDYL